MTAPFATQLVGWKSAGGRLVPNTADTASRASTDLAAAVLEILGADGAMASVVPPDPGAGLERMTRDDLLAFLQAADPTRFWDVQCGVLVSRFEQSRHLDSLDQLVRRQPSVRLTIVRDYLIKPDVAVGIVPPVEPDLLDEPWTPFLHAGVSCKWTIRSDRVQNIRHEFGQLIRHRRGRLPHLVTLTAEPLPTRLASIARGTGEVDATYHIAFDALAEAVARIGSADQREAWSECVEQGRLKSYAELGSILATW